MMDEFMKNNICQDQLILNGNVDIYQNKSQIDIWIENINEFINK